MKSLFKSGKGSVYEGCHKQSIAEKKMEETRQGGSWKSDRTGTNALEDRTKGSEDPGSKSFLRILIGI